MSSTLLQTVRPSSRVLELSRRRWSSFAMPSFGLMLTVLSTVTLQAQPVIQLFIDKTMLSPGQSAVVAPVLISGTMPSRDLALSASPQIGTIMRVTTGSFLYRAPSSLSASVNVVLSLRIGGLAQPVTGTVSIIVPTSSGTTNVAPTPPPPQVLQILPSTVSITAGSGLAFSALLNGVNTSGVVWDLNPLIGNLTSNGYYQSPASVAAPTAVQVRARLSSNLSVAATANIEVKPMVSIQLMPSSVSISPGGTAQFVSSVSGTTNSGVSWQLSPNLGTINAGLYRAPASVLSSTQVRVIATSLADPTRSASALVNITPPPITSSISLPIEVLGAAGTTASAQFALTASQVLAARNLYLQIHGLDFSEEGSVQLNGGPWIALNEGNFRLNKLDAAYGGIGGGYSTLQGRIGLLSAWLNAGTNTIRFRFNRTDGITNGFRVLAFNVEDLVGQRLLASSAFVEDNPSAWKMPYSDPTSIAQGKSLWYNAALTTPLAGGIQAKCADCHAHDGRDLKYFGYSNASIRARSQFHGLTAFQGDLIASYIRSLPVPTLGRPWNPPYQPGPGLDSRPITAWAAGAGLAAVAPDDRTTVRAIFPYGFESSPISVNGNLSAREIPITQQLPDWNHWLPQIHPKDAFAGFLKSRWYLEYTYMRNDLRPGIPSTYVSQRDRMNLWSVFRTEFLAPYYLSGITTETAQRSMYSAYLWAMVKKWEVNQEFGLEAMSRDWFGPQADDRAWMGQDSFFTSPHMAALPGDVPGLRNGSKTTYRYLSFVWYHLQLILNNSNKTQNGASPIDWPYTYGSIKDMNHISPQAGILTIWLAKAMQISQNGATPDIRDVGWTPQINKIDALTHAEQHPRMFEQLGDSERNALVNVLLGEWLRKVRTFKPSQFYSGGHTTQNELPDSRVLFDGNWPSRFLNMLRYCKAWGVNSTTRQEAIQWAQSMWPKYNWQGEL